jgi:predicted phosphoribosyltransferase
MILFKNREQAGERLARLLKDYEDAAAVVYALPRGGVVLGKIIAAKLRAPLDLIIIQKIGHPFNPEYAIGAISEDGATLYNKSEKGLQDQAWLKQEEAKERAEAIRRRQKYLPGQPMVSVRDKTAILVDDGIATGLTMLLAIAEIRKQRPKKIIVAIPVIPHDTLAKIQASADQAVFLKAERLFSGSVGSYYSDFHQLTDEEILLTLKNKL